MSIVRATFDVDALVKVYGPPNLHRVQPGNRVMLASGGPEMIVCDCAGVAPDGLATCQWMLEDGTLQSEVFKIVTLTCFGAR